MDLYSLGSVGYVDGVCSLLWGPALYETLWEEASKQVCLEWGFGFILLMCFWNFLFSPCPSTHSSVGHK